VIETTVDEGAIVPSDVEVVVVTAAVVFIACPEPEDAAVLTAARFEDVVVAANVVEPVALGRGAMKNKKFS
jgi:hypothetical protein